MEDEVKMISSFFVGKISCQVLEICQKGLIKIIIAYHAISILEW